MPRGWKCVRAARYPSDRRPSRNLSTRGGEPRASAASSSVVTKYAGKSASAWSVARSRAVEGSDHEDGTRDRTTAGACIGPVQSGPITPAAGRQRIYGLILMTFVGQAVSHAMQ